MGCCGKDGRENNKEILKNEESQNKIVEINNNLVGDGEEKKRSLWKTWVVLIVIFLLIFGFGFMM